MLSAIDTLIESRRETLVFLFLFFLFIAKKFFFERATLHSGTDIAKQLTIKKSSFTSFNL